MVSIPSGLGVARGRYAPSPTGAQHLGNIRTALLAWLQMRVLGGELVLRIEDLDPQRCRPEFEALILRDLTWLGLDWDEGPVRQSQRIELYEQALARLSSYGCVCTRRELRDSTHAPSGSEPVYPGTCRQRDTAGRPAALRWAAPPGRVTAHDSHCGTLTQDVQTEIGDFVLRRNDGAFAYQLAVVVDDGAMGITHVLRGEDLWPSTPRQVWLQRALGLPTPHYTHVPLLWADDGDKLSKRQRAPSLQALREAGVASTEIVAELARSLGFVGADVRRVSAAELIDADGVRHWLRRDHESS